MNTARHNIQPRYDKSVPPITLEEELPRVFLTRHMEGGGSLYLGPYTDVGAIRQTLRVLKTLFPIRDCPGDLPAESLTRECLYYHIGRCLAPCTGRQSVADYREGVEKLRLYLTGKASHLRELLEGEMARAASARRYELAARLRDQLQATTGSATASGRRSTARGTATPSPSPATARTAAASCCACARAACSLPRPFTSARARVRATARC
jgi:excinuclease ABC subunit C